MVAHEKCALCLQLMHDRDELEEQNLPIKGRPLMEAKLVHAECARFFREHRHSEEDVLRRLRDLYGDDSH